MDIATVDDLLTTTRSVRKRLDVRRPVEPEVLERCIEIAFQAPTGSNAQGWHFVVLTDAEKRARLAELYRRGFDLLTQRYAGEFPFPVGEVPGKSPSSSSLASRAECRVSSWHFTKCMADSAIRENCVARPARPACPARDRPRESPAAWSRGAPVNTAYPLHVRADLKGDKNSFHRSLLAQTPRRGTMHAVQLRMEFLPEGRETRRPISSVGRSWWRSVVGDTREAVVRSSAVSLRWPHLG